MASRSASRRKPVGRVNGLAAVDARAEPAMLEYALWYARSGIPVFPVYEPTAAGCSCAKGAACPSTGKHPRVDRFEQSASTDVAILETWWRRWPRANVGVAPGRAGLAVVDVDPRANGDDSFRLLEGELGELETFSVETGGGGTHYYLRVVQPVRSCSEFFGSSFPGVDVKSAGGFVVGAGSLHKSGDRYRIDPGQSAIAYSSATWLERLTRGSVVSSARTAGVPFEVPQKIAPGARRDTLLRAAGSLRAKGFSGTELLATLTATNAERCEPPLERAEVEAVAADVARRYSPSRDVFAAADAEALVEWDELVPEPVLDKAALYGVAGEWVRAIEHETEADRAALLGTLLAAIGNAAGPRPHVRVHDDQHPGRLNIVIVAPSGSGKGVSLATVKPFLRAADSSWLENCLKSGFGSGEAIIAELGGSFRTPDDDTIEHRVFIVETEFGRLLTVNSRDGSTTSQILRSAWDGNRLELRRAKEKLQASDAHLSLLGHITPEELLSKIASIDVMNGFANRCLFVLTKGSKRLPNGGYVEPAIIARFGKRFAEAIAFGRDDVGIMSRTAEANRVWDAFYLSEPQRNGVVGAICARWAPQAVRLSVIYALLDRSKLIDAEHVRAAIAFLRYTQQSAAYLWQSASGDNVADRLLDFVRERYPDAVFGREIDSAFSGHLHSDRKRVAVAMLEKRGLVERVRDAQTGGRPSFGIRAVPRRGELL